MAKFLQILLFLFLSFASINAWQKTENPKLLIVTVATSETDGFRRFKKTVQEFGHDLRVFGMGEEWRGGDMENEVRIICLNSNYMHRTFYKYIFLKNTVYLNFKR